MSASSLWRPVILAGAVLALPPHAAAISSPRLRSLPLIVEDAALPGGMVRLGSLGGYLNALRGAGHRCKLSTYAYGGNVVCRTRAGKQVLIDLVGVPTRFPEFASVGSVRPDGVNSAPVPTAELPAWLAAFKKTG